MIKYFTNNLSLGGPRIFFLALFLLFFLPMAVFAKNEIVINEIFPNPDGGDKNKEFIELFNQSKETINLEGWVLKRISRKGKIKNKKFNNKDIIKKREYLKIKFSSLNNDGAVIKLISNKGQIVSSREYGKTISGKSYNRDEVKNTEWYWAEPTAGLKNADNPQYKKYPKILINEILPNPNKDKDEFIELYNPGDKEVSLKGWRLRDGSKTGKYRLKAKHKIKAKEYIVIFKKEFKFTLNNSGKEKIILLDPNDNEKKGEFKDKISYTNTIKGQSYNRDEVKNTEWYWAEPTAGLKNADNPQYKKYPKILINEILPNPEGDEKEKEFIEIYNPNNQDVNLKNWRLRDGSSKGVYIFQDSVKIKSKKYFVIYRSKFNFSLNNSGGEEIKLIAPNGRIKSLVHYESAKENVSYNFDSTRNYWRWSQFITVNSKNRFNHLPTFKIKKPKNIYKNVFAKFELDKLHDKDKDKVKIIWNFGDGHKSYLEKTKHKYVKSGKRRIRLIIKDGSEKIIKEFSVKIKKYPKYKLKIVGFMPNPMGKDLGKEVIFIKNEDKKTINLINYKIGTGKYKNKITEHPFYDKIEIRAGEIKKITNKNICKFNLLNTSGVVQLIYPNAKIADEIYYNKEKILPNEIYYLNKNKKWSWRGGIGQNNKSIKILGAKKGINGKFVDITLDNEYRRCITARQIKVENWLEEIKDSKLWQKVLFKKLKK